MEFYEILGNSNEFLATEFYGILSYGILGNSKEFLATEF